MTHVARVAVEIWWNRLVSTIKERAVMMEIQTLEWTPVATVLPMDVRELIAMRPAQTAVVIKRMSMASCVVTEVIATRTILTLAFVTVELAPSKIAMYAYAIMEVVTNRDARRANAMVVSATRQGATPVHAKVEIVTKLIAALRAVKAMTALEIATRWTVDATHASMACALPIWWKMGLAAKAGRAPVGSAFR